MFMIHHILELFRFVYYSVWILQKLIDFSHFISVKEKSSILTFALKIIIYMYNPIRNNLLWSCTKLDFLKCIHVVLYLTMTVALIALKII